MIQERNEDDAGPMEGSGIRTVSCRMPSGLSGLSRRAYEIDGRSGDHITRIIEDTGRAYEFSLLARLNAMLRGRTEVAVDVGANIGNHSVFFATTLGARLVAVEPNPEAGALLRTNLRRLGNDGSWEILSCGVGERPGVGMLRVHDGNLGATELIPSDAPDAEGIEIRTLDDVMRRSAALFGSPIGLVKIDVEGMEVGVVRSGLEMIREHRPAMVIEISDEEGLRDIRAMLEPMGMKFFGPYCATPTYIILPGSRYARMRYLIWRVLQRMPHVGVRR